MASGWWGARLVIALATSFCPGVTAAVREKASASASASGKEEEAKREAKEARERKKTAPLDGDGAATTGDYNRSTANGADHDRAS